MLRSDDASRPARSTTLWAFLVLTYAAVSLHAVAFLAEVRFVSAVTVAFALLVHLTYCALFTAAATSPALLLHAFLPGGRWAARAVFLLAVLGTAALQFVLLADGIVLRRYGYHLNGMIWNLVTTPGGVESMDADGRTRATVAGLAALFVALQCALLVLAARWEALRGRTDRWFTRRRIGFAVAALLLAHATDRVTFGVSYAMSYKPVTTAAGAYPFYFRTRMVSLARTLGLSPPRDEDGISGADVDSVRLEYPLAPVVRAADARNLNVVWLVAESLRADMLDAEVMPATLAFAKGGRRYLRHYSAGNGTRMGMFGMFYGLYGSYWFPFLSETRSPVVLDTMIDAGYDVRAFTSAKFTFPEFDRTIFSRFPHDRLHEGDPGVPGWKNDQRHVKALLDSIDAREPGKPFFRFLFFESPHARYFFPKDAVIREDYAKSINYVTMDLSDADEIRRIRNRYVNACHHLDVQLARVYAHLEANGLLDSTVVIVTGDHGEEFMEKGRWGHHSAFSEEQTRTPLVIRAPGVTPEEVTAVTSHLDLPATVLGLLGAVNPPADYSFGFDLLAGDGRTSPPVVADWDNLCLVGKAHKIVLPVRGHDYGGDLVVTADDGAVADPESVMSASNDAVVRILKDLTRFGR